MNTFTEADLRDFRDAIMHGDAEHRLWLFMAFDALITGAPVPEMPQPQEKPKK